MNTQHPLVGRDVELAFVDRALADGGCVIAGAAGVGKTRLAREALARAEQAGGRMLWFAATRAAASIPFGAVADLLPDEGSDLTQPAQLLRAVRSRVQAMAGEGPIIVALDDAHAVDAATATVIQQLAAAREATVLVTTRTGEAVPDAIAALWKDGPCARIDLQPLSESETAELAEAVVGGHLDALSQSRLWASTSGNPLLLRELLAHVVETGSMRNASGVWQWDATAIASPRLVELVHGRLVGLDAAATDLLLLVAFGEPLPVDIVGSPRHVAELVARGLVDEVDDDRRRTIRFAHPLYGEVLRESSPAAVAAVMCRRLLDWLLSKGVRRRGDHRRAAAWALEAGVELPLATIERAATEALSAGDTALARRIAQLDRGGESPIALWVAGQALVYERRDFAEAERTLELAARFDVDDDLAVAIAIARHEALAVGLGDIAGAEAVVHDAVARLGDPAARGLLLARWVNVLVEVRPDEAAELVEVLLADSDERVPLRAVPALVATLLPSGQLQRLDELTTELLPVALRYRDEVPVAPFTLLSARMLLLVLLGRPSEAEALVGLAETVISDIDRQHARGYFAMARGRLELMRGRAGVAATMFREAIAVLDRDDSVERSQRSTSACWLAEALALQGDADGAAAALRWSTADAEANRLFRAEQGRSRAWALVAAGEVSAARDALLAVAERERSAGASGFELVTLHDVARLGAARAVGRRVGELAPLVDGPLLAAMADHVAALVDDDGTALEGVADAFAAMEGWLYAAEAATAAAAAFERQGLRARTAAALARRAEFVGRCGPVTTPALAMTTSLMPLTDREREIAQLAARGATNREIADRLVVSVRTVEGHLLRAFAKLGVTTRQELRDVLTRDIDG